MVKIGVMLGYSRLQNGKGILLLSDRLRRTIQKAGGFVIPIVQVQDVDYNKTRYNEYKELTKKEKETIDEYLNMVDGVIFSGGNKITPYDKYVLNRCLKLNKKVLGICLGMQLISSYNRNFKVEENNSKINHYQDNDSDLIHTVKIKKDTKLYEIIGKEEIKVNSFHKYHVTEPTNGLKITAISEDNNVEGVELEGKDFVLGIQWHPEISYDFDDNSKKIIDYFIKVCKKNN